MSVRFLRTAGLAAMAAGVLTCTDFALGDSLRTNAPLVIGVLLPPEQAQASAIREGLLLAEETASQLGTTPITVKIRGRVGQWGADAVEAARLATDDEAAGIIAPPDGSATHLVLQVSGRMAIPVLTLCADGSVTSAGVPWVLRTVPQTGDKARALFQWVKAETPAGSRRWVAIVPPARAGREIGGDLRKAAIKTDTDLSDIIEIAQAASTNDVCSRALKHKPDAILVWLAPDTAGAIVASLRKAGFAGTLAGPGVLESAEFTTAAGSSGEGFLIPQIAKDEDAAAERAAFEAAFVKRWNRRPDAIAAVSYDSALLLGFLLQQDWFRKAPHRLPEGFRWKGVTGEMKFDSQGNRLARLRAARIKAGRFVPDGAAWSDFTTRVSGY